MSSGPRFYTLFLSLPDACTLGRSDIRGQPPARVYIARVSIMLGQQEKVRTV